MIITIVILVLNFDLLPLPGVPVLAPSTTPPLETVEAREVVVVAVMAAGANLLGQLHKERELARHALNVDLLRRASTN